MLTVVYDKSYKDLPCICIMKAGEQAALSNLSYRYKTTHNLVPGTKIILDPDYLCETTSIRTLI